MYLSLDRAHGETLTRQLYEQLRHRILNGELQAGEQLPATRTLADELAISRNVVMEAYEMLIAEGFLEGRHGAGTFVSQGAVLEIPPSPVGGKIPLLPVPSPSASDPDTIDFRSGLPDLDLFPREVWGRLLQRVAREAGTEAFGYGKPEGQAELRSSICRYLRKTRGVLCHPDQVVITSGTTQAISLIARLLLSPADLAVIEDPITRDIQSIIAGTGCRLYPVPVDEQGICTDLLPHCGNPRLVFVTPSHQFPLGGTLTIQRRIQMIRFARETGAFLVEDDYDSEFRYSGPPLSSLQSLDPEKVIYIGTFSKTLSPALRIGYLILPPALVQECRTMKWHADLHAPSLPQLALASFLDEGHWERHILRMRKRYAKRRNVLRNALVEHFGNNVTLMGDSTGLHLVASFAGERFDPERVAAARAAGVRVYPVEEHAIQKGRHEDKLILGYGHLAEAAIEEGVRRLSQVLGR